ncbi:AfsA-related hotdog domain-containing protein [Candidatus Enterococcus mansonii]|uniref:A-factor biosynthesis hotdog domain-containing protein n=1 Tax=Candidatus Enterococcus mansonii TaxID=1834181 RepID=A0A242CK74_9ENTE|nr:AfsA-related hotdog domain-containing protein [Enterococcus sp. 4G2_DIV0659]OTO10611.1 hypothetical protein A5880_001295 [Enterococcus sp. 4G2_DIV0659]
MCTRKKKFVLSFGSKSRVNRNTIYVDSDEKFQLFSYVLEGLVDIDTEGITGNEISRIEALKSSYNIRKMTSNRDLVLSNLEKIPAIIDSYESEYVIPRIQIHKQMIHKTKQEDVMIDATELNDVPHVDLFIGYPTHTSEIKLDHIHEDHVEAILLGEVCRQSGIVSVSKQLGSDATYYITKEVKKYIKMVKREEEVLVQTFPIIANRKKGVGTCFYMLYQGNQLCMLGYYLVVYQKEKQE